MKKLLTAILVSLCLYCAGFSQYIEQIGSNRFLCDKTVAEMSYLYFTLTNNWTNEFYSEFSLSRQKIGLDTIDVYKYVLRENKSDNDIMRFSFTNTVNYIYMTNTTTQTNTIVKDTKIEWWWFVIGGIACTGLGLSAGLLINRSKQ